VQPTLSSGSPLEDSRKQQRLFTRAPLQPSYANGSIIGAMVGQADGPGAPVGTSVAMSRGTSSNGASAAPSFTSPDIRDGNGISSHGSRDSTGRVAEADKRPERDVHLKRPPQQFAGEMGGESMLRQGTQWRDQIDQSYEEALRLLAPLRCSPSAPCQGASLVRIHFL
jgi:hypothetical protein